MMMAVSLASAQTEYKGAEFCGQCHTDQYDEWAETSHANSAGLFANGTYWTAYPSRQQTLEEFKGCAECHVVGWDSETETWPEMDTDTYINVQCESCHGAYNPNHMTEEVNVIDYTLDACSPCHVGRQVEDHLNSRHSQSWEDLQESDHAGDSCLHCMTTQGAVGGEGSVSIDDEGLVSIMCAACHDPHSHENSYQLRYEHGDDLCASCHVGSHHPQAEEAVYPSGPHAKADVECVECHGQGEHFAHGSVSAWFNHTFWIYDTYWPYNDTRPVTCSKCHELEWATEQLEVIEQTTETMTEAAEEIIEAAYSVIEGAGLSEAEAADLTEAVDAASDTVHYWMADASGGLHNPEGTYAAISAAAHAANEAALEALELSNSDLEEEVSTLESEKETLESEVTSLETRVTDLEAQVEELANQGIPGFPVSSIALGLLMSAAIVFYITKPKPIS
jgi:predicted CXXCH cytochrome family protein